MPESRSVRSSTTTQRKLQGESDKAKPDQLEKTPKEQQSHHQASVMKPPVARQQSRVAPQKETKQPANLTQTAQFEKAGGRPRITTQSKSFRTKLSTAFKRGMSSHQPFRFLDLPAEVRNSIYELSIQGPHQYLAHVRLPSLAQVSRQVRDEVLPIFFSTTTFNVIVGCNFDDWQTRFKRPRTEAPTDSTAGSDALHTSRRVDRILASAGDAVILRHVVFQAVKDGSRLSPLNNYVAGHFRSPRGYQGGLWLLEDCLLVTIELHQSREAGLEFVMSAGSDVFVARLQEAFPAVQPVKIKAFKIASRERSKGFKLGDLREITKAFHLTTSHTPPR